MFKLSVDVWVEDVVQKKMYILKVDERKMNWDVSWSYVNDYFHRKRIVFTSCY